MGGILDSLDSHGVHSHPARKIDLCIPLPSAARVADRPKPKRACAFGRLGAGSWRCGQPSGKPGPSHPLQGSERQASGTQPQIHPIQGGLPFAGCP